MWSWSRRGRRARLLAQPFPAPWEETLREDFPPFAHMPEEARQALRELIVVFIDEKHWEGCGGLELSPAIQVLIAAGACLLVLELPHDIYRNVREILVYPTPIIPTEPRLGSRAVAREPVRPAVPLIGRAIQRGPVILVWDAIRRAARHPERGHNVVFHEFAHKLDMLDGRVDGAPPLQTAEQQARWERVMSATYEQLLAASVAGRATLLDPYGAASRGELFAVATEAFFTVPTRLRRGYPELYQVLSEFYRQDPARWLEGR